MMPFTATVQCAIAAPLDQVWDALTNPVVVKQYFFGSNLETTWEVGTPIFFRGEWEGKPYEDKGTVLEFQPGNKLRFNYFSAWSDLEDLPENYQEITYRVEPSGDNTLITVEQNNIDTEEKRDHSEQNWASVLDTLKKMLEKTP